MSDIQIKTFQLQNASDEQSMNEFLAGKIVRHWETSFTPADADGNGAWNVFVAYELRHKDERPAERSVQSRKAEGTPTVTRKNIQTNGQPRQNADARTPAPARHSEKAPPEEYKPNVSERDFPLYDALRKWRNSRAREERVKPFAFFNNKQLEQLVAARPEGAEAVHAIAADIEPGLWDKYHNELLAFLETANAAAGGTAPVATTPVATTPVATAPVTTAPVTTAPVAIAPVETVAEEAAPVETPVE